MIGWQARKFHYVKNPKPLDQYLVAPAASTPPKARGNSAVLAMMRRHKDKTTGEQGDGVQ